MSLIAFSIGVAMASGSGASPPPSRPANQPCFVVFEDRAIDISALHMIEVFTPRTQAGATTFTLTFSNGRMYERVTTKYASSVGDILAAAQQGCNRAPK